MNLTESGRTRTPHNRVWIFNWNVSSVIVACLMMTGVLVSQAAWAVNADVIAHDDDADDQAVAAQEKPAEPLRFLRVTDDDGNVVALEIALTTYRPAEGEGPEVALVGVAHISDASYYALLQDELDAFDVVLYESVLPPGAAGAGGDTAEKRLASTQAVLGFIRAKVEMYQEEHDSLPESLDALQQQLATDDARMARWLGRARTDAWGHAIMFQVDDSPSGYLLKSLGADGAKGGDGEDTDIYAHSDPAVRAHSASVQSALTSEDANLQMQLAKALNLAYQLEAIDYERPNWLCSDMSIDQVQRSLKQRGASFDVIGDTLTGSALPARLVNVLLRLIGMADSLMDNVITDTIKVAMIELLGDEALMKQGFAQLGEGFMEVIINERNQVAMDDLREALQNAKPDDRIAIFYGAGHMPDLHERLRDQIDYHLADQRWLHAITVDLDHSAVSRRDLNMIRRMMRQSMGGGGGMFGR